MVATIPTSFQQHPPQPSTIIINHDTSSPSNNHPYFLIHNHYIFYKTRHPTLQPTQTFTGTLLPSKCTSLHHSPFTNTNQAEQFLTTLHCHLHTQQTQPTSTTIQHTERSFYTLTNTLTLTSLQRIYTHKHLITHSPNFITLNQA